MLDSTADNSAIIETISHEACHIVGTLEHEGEGIGRYSEAGYIYYYYLTNQTIANQTVTGTMNYSVYGISNYMQLSHSLNDREIHSSKYQSTGGDSYICDGYRFDSSYQVNMSAGTIEILSGGVAESTTTSGCSVIIYPGGVAKATTMNFCSMHIHNCGLANSTILNNAYMGIYSGGVASNTVVNAGGRMIIGDQIIVGANIVSWGASCNNTIINGDGRVIGGGGSVLVSKDCIAHSTTVNSGGTFYIKNGALATAIKENGGYVFLEENASASFEANTINGLNISNHSMTLHSGTTANETTVNSSGYVDIYSGGKANYTTVNSRGLVKIYSGGVANFTTVNNDGHVYLFNGCEASSTTVNSTGYLEIFGGTVKDITVSSGGRLDFSPSYMSSGIVLNGEIELKGRIELGGILTISTEIIEENLDFVYDLTSCIPSNSVMVSNLSYFTNVNSYTISMMSSQCEGVYILGDHSDNLVKDFTLSIVDNGQKNTFAYNPELDIWENIVLDDYIYKLTRNSSGTLQFNVKKLYPVKLYDDDELTSDAITMSGVVLDKDGNNRMVVSSGGTAIDTALTSETGMQVSSGGTATDTVLNQGANLQLFSGGIVNSATVSSGGILSAVEEGILEGQILLKEGKLTTTGEITATEARIVFDLTESLPDEMDIMVDNLADLSSASYSISVTSSQEDGVYRLAGGADGFNGNVTLSVGGTGGVFSLAEKNYDSLLLNDKLYTLINTNDELYLRVGAQMEVYFSIDEIHQIEYYDGEGSERFSTTVLKVPYLATATVTMDKYIPDGEYTFTTFLDDYDDASVDFLVQVIDGVPSYISSNACYFGKLLEEDDFTATWRFNNIEDFLLTEKADSSMPIGIRYEENGFIPLILIVPVAVGGVLLLTGCSDNNVETVNEDDCDANKDGFYLQGDYEYIIDSNNKYTITFTPTDSNNDNIYDKYSIIVRAPEYNGSITTETSLFSIKGSSLDRDIPIRTTNLGYDLVISKDDNRLYKQINGVKDEKAITGEKPSWRKVELTFALMQKKHCWIAVAANMLYKGSYLPKDYNAQKCFEELSKKYFKTDGFSRGGNATDVFKDLKDLGLSPSLYIEYGNDVYKGLDNLKNQKNGTEVAAAIGLDYGLWSEKDGVWTKTIYKHEITCLSVTKLNEDLAEIRYADSDRDIDKQTVKTATIKKNAENQWVISFGEKRENKKRNGNEEEMPEEVFHVITSFTTLLGRTKGTTQQTLNIEKIIPRSVSEKISASQYYNVTNNVFHLTVNGSITNAVVEAEGVLEIASGATADTMYIHDNASVVFDAGSTVSGKIMTYGGEISVASGADVSNAEIVFNIVNLAADNMAILDNLQNAQEAVLMVTVGCNQVTGRYLLANGAAGFDGSVTVSGATYGEYFVREGFADGELGTLTIGETLEIANQLYTLSVENDALAFTVAWAKGKVLYVEADTSCLTIEPVIVTAVFSEDIVLPEYSYDGENWIEYVDGVTMTENGFVWFRGTDANGNQSEVVQQEIYNIIHYYAIDGGDANGLNLPESTSHQLLELSNDNYNHSLKVEVETDRVNLHGLPAGTYCWKVRDVDDVEWSLGNEITTEGQQEMQLLSTQANDNFDAFFGNERGIWGANYVAKHVGVGEWAGTGQAVVLEGKNVIGDIFVGSEDASILLLTDDANGDALFVDDIFSAFPDGLEAQARLARIGEIRAGAGNDVVDLTSQRFAYVGDGMTVRGGLGDDVIWANSGDNLLFGDAGNDNLVGAGGNDVLVGGSGDDTLHGGGGDDLFAFGGDWGNDTVVQLATGKVTLWFQDGDEADAVWNAEASMLTYTDGNNSVTVAGVSQENITLKFGDDGSEQYDTLLAAGAFDGFTSERIFENRGMLA